VDPTTPSTELAERLALLLALAFLLLAGGLLAWWEWRKIKPGSARAANPLQLTTAPVFTALFLGVSLATAWVEATFGQAGILTLAALVGLSDITPFVLSLAQGGAPSLGLSTLAAAVLIAASANNLAKAGYAIGFGGLAAAERRRSCSPSWLCSALLLPQFIWSEGLAAGREKRRAAAVRRAPPRCRHRSPAGDCWSAG
jgi:uncharacterized membrane protein (DUF4010 family)